MLMKHAPFVEGFITNKHRVLTHNNPVKLKIDIFKFNAIETQYKSFFSREIYMTPNQPAICTSSNIYP